MGSVDASEWSALGIEISAHASGYGATSARETQGVGRRLENTAQALAPVRTGRLKQRTRATVIGHEITLTADTDYAGYVEEGTSDTAAQPFVGPAFDRHVGDLGGALLDVSLDL